MESVNNYYVKMSSSVHYQFNSYWSVRLTKMDLQVIPAMRMLSRTVSLQYAEQSDTPYKDRLIIRLQFKHPPSKLTIICHHLCSNNR